jgi:excisionase family DNA binding protein
MERPEQQPQPVKLAYSYEEAEAVTGVSRSTLKRAVKDGELACCKVGIRTLFTPQQLEKWLRTKEFRLKPRQ